MTMQSFPPFNWPWPDLGRINTTAYTTGVQSSGTMDGVSDAVCWVGDAPATGNLTDIYWRTNTVSVTSGPLNWDVRVEQLTNLRPNGTLWGTNTNFTQSIATTDGSKWNSAFGTAATTLTSAASVTRGTPIGIVVKAPGAGTFNVTWAGWTASANGLPPPANFPIAAVDTNGDGTYDTAITTTAPTLAVKIDGVIYPLPGASMFETMPLTSFNNGSGNDEFAIRIYTPVPLRVIGIDAFLGNVAAGADFSSSLWPDSAGSQTDANALGQASTDGDGVVSTTQDGWVRRLFATAVTLTKNTVYWAGVRADTANNISMVLPTLTVSGFITALYGAEVYGGQRSWSAGSANAFSTLTTTVPWVRLVVDGLDDGATTGGSLNKGIQTGGGM